MSARTGSQAATRRRGLVTAAVVGLLLVGVVSWIIARQPSAPNEGLDGAIEVPDPGAITHVPDRPGTSASVTGPAEGLRIQVEARLPDGSTRLASEFIAERVDPLENQNYRLDRPEAWYFLEDGRIVHVRADSARVVMPDREREPQSGTLSGAVRVRLFDAGDSSGVAPGPDAEPALLAEFDSMNFNSAEGSMYTNGPLHVVGNGIDLRGIGLTLIVDEVRDRISFLEIRREGRLRVASNAGGARRGEPDPVAPTTSPAPVPVLGGDKPDPPTRPAKNPIITIYAASADGDVIVRQGQRELGSEKLDGWIRLLDGELPDQAIARIAFAPAKPEVPQASPPAPADPGRDPAGVPTPRSDPLPALDSESVDDQGIELTWSGPFVLRPLPRKPPELEHDHVALRLHSPDSGVVRFQDAQLDASGTCGEIEYGATSGDLALNGSTDRPTRFGSSELGALVAPTLALNLLTGVGTITGGGTFTKPTLGTASWSEGGDFSLAAPDGRVSGALRSITLTGDVGLIGETGEAYGQSLAAEFDVVPGNASLLSRAIIADEGYQATLSVGDDRSITGRVIDTTFVRRGERSIPRDLIVEGNARLRQGDAMLDAARLDATLDENAQGQIVATWARASGGAGFVQTELQAKADEIVAFPEQQLVDLVGDEAFVQNGSTRVDGSQIRLNGLTRVLWVPSAGRFAHRGASEGEPARVEASWTREMVFDDRAGVVECTGEALARSYPSDLEQDTVRGERVRIELDPAAEDASDSATNPGSLVLSPGSRSARRVLRAAAFGAEDGSSNASVESLAWAEPASVGVERAAPWRVLFLEGPSILADNPEQSLGVDRAGRLVVSDQRPTPESSEPGPVIGGRGASLFEWAGSMRFERGTGKLAMNDRVTLTHRRAADSLAMVLRCAALEADIRQKTGDAPADALASRTIDGELVSARATGGVALAMGGKELSAAEIRYDAVRGIVTADSGASPVLLFDSARGTTVSAASLEWNLSTDEVRIVRPYSPGAIPAPERPR